MLFSYVSMLKKQDIFYYFMVYLKQDIVSIVKKKVHFLLFNGISSLFNSVFIVKVDVFYYVMVYLW